MCVQSLFSVYKSSLYILILKFQHTYIILRSFLFLFPPKFSALSLETEVSTWGVVVSRTLERLMRIVQELIELLGCCNAQTTH